MHDAQLKFSLFTRIFECVCKSAPLFDEVDTVLYLCAGCETILRKRMIELLQVTRGYMKPFERI
jgi:hypothetical protein